MRSTVSHQPNSSMHTEMITSRSSKLWGWINLLFFGVAVGVFPRYGRQLLKQWFSWCLLSSFPIVRSTLYRPRTQYQTRPVRPSSRPQNQTVPAHDQARPRRADQVPKTQDRGDPGPDPARRLRLSTQTDPDGSHQTQNRPRQPQTQTRTDPTDQTRSDQNPALDPDQPRPSPSPAPDRPQLQDPAPDQTRPDQTRPS
ncbi:hypothetical protein WMY93_032449 [Mugilogobius chulae]|uniref:Uncharacterized protein n=1 Tax=Mugilogobius chulae TaxID=88201 RepID=A0AAW0MWS5_9GOBI